MFSSFLFAGHSQNFWVNLLGFNLVWSLSIFVGNPAIPIVVCLLVLHLLLHQQFHTELQVVLMTGSVGYCIDCFLTLLGFFRFDTVQGITPLWLLFLWLAFCATLRQSLAYFSRHRVAAALFGAFGGTSAYMAAAHFGAVELGQSFVISSITLGLIWILLFPLLVWMSKTIEVELCR